MNNQIDEKGMPTGINNTDNQIDTNGMPAEREATTRLDEQMNKMC